MKQFSLSFKLKILGVLFFFVCIRSSMSQSKEEKDKILRQFKLSTWLFGSDVVHITLKRYRGNFMVNHLFIHLVLSLVTNGSKGQTFTELNTTLRLPKNLDKVQSSIRTIRDSLKKLLTNEYKYKVATKVFIQDGFPLKDQFSKHLSNFYNTEVSRVNFNKINEAANEMNAWISKNTHNQLKKVLDPKAGDSVVIVNTLDFGPQTEPTNPVKMLFEIEDGKQVEIDALKTVRRCGLIMQPDFKALSMDLGTPGLSLIIVMPKNKMNSKSELEIIGDNDVIRKFNNLRNFKKQVVEVVIPKFKIESNINIIDILKEKGITAAFSDSADFSGIADQKLKLSRIVDSSYLELNSIDDPYYDNATATETFKALMPFLFYIRWNVAEVDVNFVTGIYNSPNNL